MQIWFVILLLFSAIITLFAVINPGVVTIRLFWFDYDLSQSLVILLSAAFGAIFTILLGILGKIKSGLKIKVLNSELVSANQKIQLLNDSLKVYEQNSAQVVQQTPEIPDSPAE